MRSNWALSLAAAIISAEPALAIEGPSAAGPIGGTDVRSGMLPPPGIYLGSVGFGAMLPSGNQCGSFTSVAPEHCTTALGDAYVEVDWSRFFGTVRPSQWSNAYPILEGLSVLAGFGVVLPAGQFDSSTRLEQTISIGNNTWTFASSFAVTYTTPPILAEGTELSFKVFWNNYLENSITNYRSGDLINVDSAVTEHIGPFQVGIAGVYAAQTEDDVVNGAPAPPGGNRGELLQLGGVLNYDIPSENASIRVKANTTVDARNTVDFSSIAAGWIKKF